MSIDEAIAHAREVAERRPVEDRQCAHQHDKLADWLEELKMYRDTGFTPADVRDMRNELCLRCGKYKDAHTGACDGCRFKQ